MKRLTDNSSMCDSCPGIAYCRADCKQKQIYDKLKRYEDSESNLEWVINEIQELHDEANRRANSAACGYDEGWYNGEGNAYAIVLYLLRNEVNFSNG